jgi:hypothetical protein
LQAAEAVQCRVVAPTFLFFSYLRQQLPISIRPTARLQRTILVALSFATIGKHLNEKAVPFLEASSCGASTSVVLKTKEKLL